MTNQDIKKQPNQTVKSSVNTVTNSRQENGSQLKMDHSQAKQEVHTEHIPDSKNQFSSIKVQVENNKKLEPVLFDGSMKNDPEFWLKKFEVYTTKTCHTENERVEMAE
ncbi:hypothetical protein BB559_006913 [Furculomyces boomerangus]|uniref:Uncharacterized protein n=1 Tax=Furculomyces boomerangus TaxID=61424 RepID=A0A2T9Y014_9FUNG|nr:hypothetical protein BB559_006913 [Furculomyces boomerangus]